ncbi:MAG TPA: SDR family oxidoreductase [Chitinophagaceae bacterium]|nr:SDR family oxidoreductase [Chitinophagaceae bacterium]
MRILITGGAGFIGSNIVEKLLQDQRVTLVRVMDNLSTGHFENIKEFIAHPRFQFLEGDIRSYDTCIKACDDIDLISHQAALGSVPRSINDPLTTNDVNITGTLNIFTAAKQKKIKRIVYAASSSTYGDSRELPKKEEKIGKPLSPYAVTKYVNELYAKVYADLYGIELIGLRYFNIFGPKQDPAGPYAAVIPVFIRSLLENKSPTINGDGGHSRDFTYVDNAVHANLLSLFTSDKNAINQVYNIACGEQTSLNEMYAMLKKIAGSQLQPVYGPDRKGDVRDSLADISKAKQFLSYEVSVPIAEGLSKTFNWFRNKNISEKKVLQ